MRTIAFLSTLFVVFSTSSALSGPKTKVSVQWKDFPKGTECSAEGIHGSLKIKRKRGHPVVEVKGYGEIGTFFCVLPDGRKIISDINKRLPEGTRVAGTTVYPNGRTFLTASTAAGLMSQEFHNTFTGVSQSDVVTVPQGPTASANSSTWDGSTPFVD